MEPRSLPRFGVPLALVLLALWVAPAASPACAQAKKGKPEKPVVTTIRVKVTVLDPEGKPLRGAGVVLKQVTVDAGRIPKHAFDVELHTDSKGKVEVQGFEPGIVLVQVIAHEYQTYGQAFIMKNADEAVHVKLKPPRAQVTIYH